MSTNTAVVENKKAWTAARVRNLIIDIVIWAILIIVSLLCLLPFIHVLSKSISEEAYVVANKVVLLPKGFSLNAYQKIFADASIMRSMYVTVVVTISFTVIGMFLTICAAYVLSRRNLKGRKVMTFLIMLTMYFVAGTIPDYLLMSNLHMLDTWWCLILPLCFAPYNLLIMKNNFQSNISDSLIEAAVIDGANHFTILAKIVVPLSKPIIATIALFYAVGRWNAYQDALYYIKQNTSLRPLQLKLYYLVVAATESFQAEGGNIGVLTNPEVLKAACVIFATVPIIIVYPFLQKYFVQGTMVGAVKE
ncbi:MAG: carbohydrate ABC transporter permease [bacterium]|nr:carbohydrate ABC transporter permease [bacterium]MDY4100437.1 carbohydrate ABC transporter permease [Lachnospiraceae bacterium]